MTYKDPERQRDAMRQYYYRRQGLPDVTTQPPAGYISSTQAAERLCYSVNWIAIRAKRGDFGPIWQRGPRGQIYINEEALHSR